MKSAIIEEQKIADDLRDTIMNMAFPGRPDKKVFKIRDLPGFGYEIFGIKKDKIETVVFRLKMSGPPKFRRMKMEYDPKLISIG